MIPPIIAFGVGGIDPARQAIVNLQSKAQEKAGEIKDEAYPSGPTPARRTTTTSAAAARRRTTTSRS